MIDYIIGKPTETAPAVAVIETNGIGYEVAITLLDYPNIQGKDNVKIYIHEVFREDAHVLFGFLDKETREAFRLLIGVSGVGPNTARLILSSLTVGQLEDSIAAGNDHLLKSVKGIGGKTAQRIIVDLKDKIKIIEKAELSSGIGGTSSDENFKDALAALVMLGFTQAASQKTLRKIYAGQADLSAEDAIKLALKML